MILKKRHFDVLLLFIFYLIMVLIPQLLYFNQCPIESDMAQYYKLAQNPFGKVINLFTYRVFVPLLVYIMPFEINISFWFISAISALLYFIVSYFVFKEFFKKINFNSDIPYYSTISTIILIFCFIFQFFYIKYIHVTPFSIFLAQLTLLLFLKDKTFLLSIAIILSVFTKENNIIFLSYIFIYYLLKKDKKILLLILAIVSYLFLRLFWFKGNTNTIIDNHFNFHNIKNIIEYHLNIFPRSITATYGVFGILYLFYFNYLLKDKRYSLLNVSFFYFIIVAITSLFVTATYLAFIYLAPFLVISTVLYYRTSNYKKLIIINIIILNIIMISPYIFPSYYEKFKNIRFLLSLFFSFMNIISFFYILYKDLNYYKINN